MAKRSTLFISKLQSSGLTEKDADILGLQEIGSKEVAELTSIAVSCNAIKIPYFDFSGRPLLSHPGFPPFFRVRLLKTREDEAKEAEANANKKKKPLRYFQPADSGVCAYFPQSMDWASIKDDSNSPVLITEGELKAAKGCKEGFPTIGLGGVSSWKSARQGIAFLPELEAIRWTNRHTYIVFDSDFKTNINVCKALIELAEELYLHGALPRLVTLPTADDGSKVGLDDYLLVNSPESMDGLLDEAEDMTMAKALWALNEKIAYAKDPGIVVALKHTSRGKITKMSPNIFKDSSEYSTISVPIRELRPDGTVSMKSGNAAAEWLKWRFRNELECMTYKPGYPKLVGEAPHQELNIWPGWGTTPKKGDVDPFLELINHIFKGSSQDTIDWFLNWCAYPIQYPGTKLFTAAVIYGIKHGTGKSLIGYTLGRIYGQNFTEISSSDLHGGFNEWAEGKQLVMGDDVTGSNKRQDSDMLKKLITQRELRINAKYMNSYVVPDCVNYLFTSNHPDAFFLEEDDRRYFIHEVKVKPMDEEWYIEYQLWLDSGGAQALFQYLLDRDTSGFNPAAPALKTDAKKRMIEDVRSDLGSWVATLRDDPSTALTVNGSVMGGDLFTAKELLAVYAHDNDSAKNVTANGMTRELRRQGIQMVLGGANIKTAEGHQRVYIIRDLDFWLTCESRFDIESHLKRRGVEKSSHQ